MTCGEKYCFILIYEADFSLHSKKYLNKNFSLRIKGIQTTVFFITEQQKDFYHKMTEIPNKA